MVKDEEAGLGDDIYDGGYQEPSDSDEKLKQWEMEAEQVNQLEALREKELDQFGNSDPKLTQIEKSEKSIFQEFPSDSDSSALVDEMQDKKYLQKSMVYQSPTRTRHAMLPASARSGSRHKFSKKYSLR